MGAPSAPAPASASAPAPRGAPPPREAADNDELPPSYEETVSSPVGGRPSGGSSPRPPLPPHHPGAQVRSSASYAARQPAVAVPLPPPPMPEEDQRPLPPGWIRQWDAGRRHEFYVDQQANHGAGRSTWVHPYQDPHYLASLPREQAAQVHWDNTLYRLRRQGVDVSMASPPLNVRPYAGSKPGVPPVGDPSRKVGRQGRKENERRHAETLAEAQARLNYAFQVVRSTGRPMFLQRDTDGKDVVVLPPRLVQPGAPDPFMYLIQDDRLKCIRTPTGNGVAVVERKHRNGALVGGVVGGAILGALLL